MANFTLANRNGGFAFVTKDQAKAWQNNPTEAVNNFPELKENLDKQTHGRGYNYSDFTLYQKGGIKLKQK